MQSKIVAGIISCYVIFMFFACVPGNRKLPEVLKEVSGVARLSDGSTYWLNDGGNGPVLFTNAFRDETLQRFGVSMENVDWEALSPYRDSLLCICDIGDNRRKRDHINIAIVDRGGVVLEQRKLTYPVEPFNAEACAIKGETFYLLTKARIGKTGAPDVNMAYLMTLDLQSDETVLTLKDELNFPNRSVTDMAWLNETELAIVAYDFRRKAAFAKTPTTVYTVEVGEEDHFRATTLRQRKVAAPFTWTQYEAILPIGNGEVMIASEKTILFPPRWRVVSLPK